MTEGTMTEFAGILFGRDKPYSYSEARRVLGLALDRLRSRAALIELGVDPGGRRRFAIKGRRASGVWDALPLKETPRKDLSRGPHLDLGIEDHRVRCALWLPHNYLPRVRSRLRDLSEEEWLALLHDVRGAMRAALAGMDGTSTQIVVQQVRWVNQSKPGVHDAQLNFDLDTVFGSDARRKESKVHLRSAWHKAARAVIADRGGNVEMGFQAAFEYDRCQALRSPNILATFERVWLATRPVLDLLRRDGATRVSTTRRAKVPRRRKPRQ